MNACDWMEPLLDLLASGAELSAEEHGAVERHLAECAACRALLEQQRALFAQWSVDLRAEPSPAHRVELTTRIIERVERRSWPAALWQRLSLRMLAPAAAVLLAALLVNVADVEQVSPTRPADEQPIAQQSEYELHNPTGLVTIAEISDAQLELLDQTVVETLTPQGGQTPDLAGLHPVVLSDTNRYSMTAGLDDDQLGQLVEALDDLTITLDEENQG